MLLYRATAALGLRLFPLAGLAQAPASPPAYYVGAGLYSSTFQNLGYHYGLTIIPVQLTVGYRWRPRWAVQLSAAYSGSSADYDDSGQFLDPATNTPTGTFSNAGRATDRRLSLALLARRTLTRQPAHRAQFDAVGGLIYEHLSYHEQGVYTSTNPAAPAYNPYDYRSRYNGARLGLGPAMRVRVAAPLEATLDFLLTAPLGSQSGQGIASATSLGLRYSFGQRPQQL